MKRIPIHIVLISSLALLLTAGCGYFNTFYNAQRLFGQAERETRAQENQARRQQAQHPQQQSNPSSPNSPPGGTPPAGAPGQTGASGEKYHQVIETSSRMLEDHPQSRWADDALFIMGISYYRLGDLPRSERKFTELLTLFPKSTLVPQSTLWKARTLSEQKKKDEALELLQSGLQMLRGGRDKASALFLMGSLCSDLKRYADAAGYFRESASIGQPRQDHVNALYAFANAELMLDSCEQARDAYAVVARDSRDVQQAYDASIRCSQCEVRLHNSEKAEAILDRLRSGERFLDYADDISLQRAQLTVQVGQVDAGMKLYQEFIDQHQNSERRGLAFYRLALINRDQRADLPLAKSLLDSTTRSGASREISDSARVAMDQIGKGLLALEKIKTLQESIRSLHTQADSMKVAQEALAPKALLAYEDSVRKREEALKPVRPKEVAPLDTAQLAMQDVKADTSAHSAKPDSIAHAATHKPAARASDAAKKPVEPAPQMSEVAKSGAPAVSPATKAAMADSNQTWDMARRTFHSFSLADRIGLLTLTHAIETRDSTRDAGDDQHRLRVQTIINRAYGIGGTRVTPAVDSVRAIAVPKVVPKAATTPVANDSAGRAKGNIVAPKIAVDSVTAPLKSDSIAKPLSPDTLKPRGERHSMREFRSTPSSPGGAPPDSGRKPAGSDTVSVVPPAHIPVPVDSVLHTVPMQVSDSMHRVVAKPDTVRTDSIHNATVLAPSQRADTVAAAPAVTSDAMLRTQLLTKERELQLAYLHTAEFYSFSLSERDSALNYYRLAASSPVNADVYWRANLYLGQAMSQSSDSARTDYISDEAAQHFRAVVEADSVPVDAANRARAALKMPLLEVPVPEQLAALRAAENAQLVSNAPVDSVVRLYSNVITLDSASTEGKKALFAKATLLEQSLHQKDQARVIYERLLKMNPDSMVAVIARGRIAPPDTNSIFLMSDAQLSGKREPISELFDQKQDESGWPASEESLRGRHFR